MLKPPNCTADADIFLKTCISGLQHGALNEGFWVLMHLRRPFCLGLGLCLSYRKLCEDFIWALHLSSGRDTQPQPSSSTSLGPFRI